MSGFIDKFRSLFRHSYLQYALSLFIGLGLASIFHRTCRGKSCVREVPMAPAEVAKKSFRSGNECYTFEPRYVSCRSKEMP